VKATSTTPDERREVDLTRSRLENTGYLRKSGTSRSSLSSNGIARGCFAGAAVCLPGSILPLLAAGVVEAGKQTAAPAKQPRAIPFDDNEDLDVPDFLK